MTVGSSAMTPKKSAVDCSRLPVIHCCASIQASTLTAHIQQGDVLVSVNGISLVTYGDSDTAHKSAEEIIKILKLAKSPKIVRFLRLIRSTGDLLSRGANAADVQLDSYETSLLNDNVKRSRIPKFVVTRAPAGKIFDPTSSSLFDVVFSYQASLGIRIRSYKLNRWKEVVKEKVTTAITNPIVPRAKEIPSSPLSVAFSERDLSQDGVGETSSSSSSPSVFSSSSLWKLFECEEELYQSHCYFSGEILKDEVDTPGGSTRITTAETTPARIVDCESSFASSELASPASACTSPRTDTQDQFILTYPETYKVVNEKTVSEDLIPPPKMTEVPFFTNPMPAAANKMVKLNLRRSSDSRAFEESNLKKSELQTFIMQQEEKSPLIRSDDTSRSSLSVSPLSSVGKSVGGGPSSPRYVPQFSPDLRAPMAPRVRVLSLDGNQPNISTTKCLLDKRTGTSSTILRSNAFNVVLDSPDGQSLRCPTTVKPFAATSPDLLSYKSSLKTAFVLDEKQKNTVIGATNNKRESCSSDIEGIKEESRLTEVEVKKEEENEMRCGANRTTTELDIVKEELVQLQRHLFELMSQHRAEISKLSAELAEAKEVAKYLAGDVLDIQAEKDHAVARRLSSEHRASVLFNASEHRASSVLSDAERLMEVERKIQTQVLSRMVDLDDSLSQSSTAITVQYVHSGRDLATRTSGIRRDGLGEPEVLEKETSSMKEIPHIKETPIVKDTSITKEIPVTKETSTMKETAPVSIEKPIEKPIEKLSLVKQMIAATEKAAAENAGQNQRNIDYQATKNKLGLGALGAPVSRFSVSQGAGVGVGGPVDGYIGSSKTSSSKAADLSTASRRRSSRGSIRNSLSSGGEANMNERPPWWRVR